MFQKNAATTAALRYEVQVLRLDENWPFGQLS
jgi:hypothetical protein